MAQPLAVFEEVGGVVGVELIPPLMGLCGEAASVEGGDGVRALEGKLMSRVGGVDGVGGRIDVVPGVESAGGAISSVAAREMV